MTKGLELSWRLNLKAHAIEENLLIVFSNEQWRSQGLPGGGGGGQAAHL